MFQFKNSKPMNIDNPKSGCYISINETKVRGQWKQGNKEIQFFFLFVIEKSSRYPFISNRSA